MKRIIVLAGLLPTAAPAQFTFPDVQFKDPPSDLEYFLSNSENWVLIGILAVLVVIGALLWVRSKSSSKD